jgi:hypothetical protein
MRSQAFITMALSLILAQSAFATGRATGDTKAPTVAKSQVRQSSSGCGSPNIGENSGRLQVQVSCQMVTVLGLRTRMSSLEIHQDRLLLAKNPTELRITNAYLRSWLPDHGRVSLTLEFENPRDIPIPEIEVDFLDPRSGSSIPKLKPIRLTPSGVYREIGTRKFSLAAGGKAALPVAFLDEIARDGQDGCPFDAAVTGDPPPSKEAPSDPAHPNSASQTGYQALLVRTRFKTIFDQEVSSTSWIWIVHGQGSDGAQFWYPSEKRWGKLICAH